MEKKFYCSHRAGTPVMSIYEKIKLAL